MEHPRANEETMRLVMQLLEHVDGTPQEEPPPSETESTFLDPSGE